MQETASSEPRRSVHRPSNMKEKVQDGLSFWELRGRVYFQKRAFEASDGKIVLFSLIIYSMKH